MKARIGVDLGGSHFAVGVFGKEGELLVRRTFSHPEDTGVRAMARAIASAARACAEQAGLREEDVTFCGVGMPSCVHPVTQRLVHSNNLGWIDCEVYPDFRAELPWPVRIENDANCAAIGEAKLGAGAGKRNVLLLTLGTGVGGGVILDGKLYTGADGMGAELGHTKLVFDGRRCTCGQKGCLEAYASATALIAMAREDLERWPDSALHGGELSGRTLFAAAAQGDGFARMCVERYAEYLSGGLASFITIFRPEIIVLGGGIASAGEPLFALLREKTARNTFAARQIGIPPIVPAVLGNDAGIIGAAFQREYIQ